MGGLFTLSKTIVSVLRQKKKKKTRMQAQVQALGSHAAEDQKQIRTSNWWINRSASVHTKFYCRD